MATGRPLPRTRPAFFLSTARHSRSTAPASCLWLRALRQYELVGLLRRGILRRPGVPGRNRSLLRRIQRLHRLPHFVYAVGEKIADQQIGDRALELGIVADEVAEAEAVVVLADEAAHAVDTFVERRPPLTELCGRRVVLRQTLDDRVRGHLSGPERQQHAG